MDKTLQSNLLGILNQDLKTWDSVWREGADWDKGEIPSCCSYHAIEVFVSSIDSSNDLSTDSVVKAIKPGLDESVLNAINNYKCDDDEHNGYIEELYDAVDKEISNQ
ncbi:uncharacterized protein METZ01_LOCUS275617 [marine metagenome]|uniref:Uncharacterized protein n=1 Tax=marine metagenome TaxID=408172 RepID=A0A382KH55_9ZZZZ